MESDKGRFLARWGSPKHQERAMHHDDENVRRKVAVHGTDAHRDHLVNDESPHVVAVALSGRKKEHLDKHVNSSSPIIRGGVAQYGEYHHQAKLMHDPDSDVREQTAHFTPHQDIIHHLSNDHDQYVRAAIATNEHTPDHILNRLRNDEHPYVHRHADNAYNRRHRSDEWIAEDVGHMTFAAHQKVHHNIDAMMHDPDHEVRLKAASKGSKHHLDQLVNDSHPAVRGEVALRGHSDHLDKLMHDPHENVRQIVAIRGKHQHVKHLTNDSDPVVRQLASKHPSMRMNEETIIADIRTKLLES